jgi:hypothetical protein
MPDRLTFRGAIKASADDGTVYLIDVFEITVDETPGPLLCRTSEGKSVKRLVDGIYKIEENGLVLRSLSGFLRLETSSGSIDWRSRFGVESMAGGYGCVHGANSGLGGALSKPFGALQPMHCRNVAIVSSRHRPV